MTAPLWTEPRIDSPQWLAVRAWLRDLWGPRWPQDARARWLEAMAAHIIDGAPVPPPVSSSTWRAARIESLTRRIEEAGR